jgi:AbrB family looped-hinge helix DNA binding protein
MNATENLARINQNGRIVIPASFRRALGIKSGDTIVLRIENDELRMTTLRQRLAKAQRLVRKHVPPTVSLVDELIAERREAAKRE